MNKKEFKSLKVGDLIHAIDADYKVVIVLVDGESRRVGLWRGEDTIVFVRLDGCRLVGYSTGRVPWRLSRFIVCPVLNCLQCEGDEGLLQDPGVTVYVGSGGVLSLRTTKGRIRRNT